MTTLHEAARRVVAAWAGLRPTRPSWINDVNAAVLSLGEALKAEPAQGPVAAAFSAAFGAEQHSTDDRVVIERRGETLHLNGQKIGPGTLEIRRDGVTYRAAERVAVKPEPAQEADPTDPGHDIDVLREHVRHLERRVRELHAQQAKPAQEPVAWMVYTLDGKSVCVTDNPADFTDEHKALPLYATPQPETAQREPVAWMYHGIRHDGTPHDRPSLIWRPEYMDAMSASKGAQATPLYTTPQPQRPPLTNEEIVDAVREADLDWQAGWTLDEHEPNRFTTLARAIERKVRGEA